MDERDVRLLKAIAELETGSPERLHEATDIPISTIHYRLNNLRDEASSRTTATISISRNSAWVSPC